ncbi:MAG: HEAT repeat domain-containing protein, partial [Thermoleophilia bacterium]|nr:HEAT repeat domain-containing protein [Thermoleophilia bacterium]
PALSIRRASQRRLSRERAEAVEPLVARLRTPGTATGRIHALWALDAIEGVGPREAIRGGLTDPDPEVRLQAARSSGIRKDAAAGAALRALVRDPVPSVRREAAIALGRLGDRTAAPALYGALGDPDPFVAWAIRRAIRDLGAWDTQAIAALFEDRAKREDAFRLTDEAWALPVVEGLIEALGRVSEPDVRTRIVANLAGLTRTYPTWSGNWFGTNPLAGQFPQKTRPWDSKGMARVQEGLALALKDAAAPVRLGAIAGLVIVGGPAIPTLREAVGREADPKNLAALAEGLGVLGDFPSAPLLGALAADPNRPEGVRLAALEGLGRLRGPQALNARLSVVYDEKASARLVARALPPLGREGVLPPNDLMAFLERPDATIRAAALLGMAGPRNLPSEVQVAILARLDDAEAEVRRAAATVVVTRKLREAVPRLLAAAETPDRRDLAVRALIALPDPRAVGIYLGALGDRDAELRQGAQDALLAIRDQVGPRLEDEARSGRYGGPAAVALERVLTRFRPVTDWRVIGPFARTTAQVFVGESIIDFQRKHSGAEGREIAW